MKEYYLKLICTRRKGLNWRAKRKNPEPQPIVREKNQQLNWNSTEKRQCGLFWFSKFESLRM